MDVCFTQYKVTTITAKHKEHNGFFKLQRDEKRKGNRNGNELPQDFDLEELIERLVLVEKVEKG